MRNWLLLGVGLVVAGTTGSCGDNISPEAFDAAPTGCFLTADCDDGEYCTTDWCDANGVCHNVADQEAEECDDGDPCTEHDTCNNGVCEATPVDCSGATDFCNVGSCDPETGECVRAPLDDDTPCNDGVYCTDPDVCTDGVCGGGPRDCSSLDDDCNHGECDDDLVACVQVAINQGLGCDDGLFCTDGDICNRGVCAGTERDCSSATDQCNTGVCDEGLDACVGDPVMNGLTCQDGDYCTVGDQCSGGDCQPGTLRDCSALDGQCVAGYCDETENSCATQPAHEGDGCNDNLYCNVGEICQEGLCQGGGPRDCTDPDACTADSCDEGGDTCVNSPVPPIPGAEGPPGDATCSDGEDNDCDGKEDLEDPSCAACTGDEECDDGNQCTADSCNPSTLECDNLPLSGTSCSDGTYCTDPDTCTNGSCGGPPRDCSGQSDQCNVGACSETLGSCVKNPAHQGNSCNDNLYCTNPDTCDNGACGGPPRDCTDWADACNDGLCDEDGSSCYANPLGDGTLCTPLYCMIGQSCQEGSCTGGAVNPCDDDDGCTMDSCNELGNTCDNPPLQIDPNSTVAHSAAGAPCLTAETEARLLVWTDLVDLAGAPITAAVVTIGGATATESTARPGTYYRAVLAAGTPSTTEVTVVATACGDTETLSSTVSIDNVAPNSTAGGTGGCSPVGGNLRVRVVDEGGTPILGASVLIGQSSGAPFETSAEALFGGTTAAGANTGLTDDQGYLELYDYGTALDGPVTVTAGAADRAYMTIASGDAADLVLALPLLHPTLPSTTVYGDGATLSFSNCGDVDAAIILPRLQLDFFTQFDSDALFEPKRCWFSGNGSVGDVAAPSNLWVPAQGIGPLCFGGSLNQAAWSLTLDNTADTGSFEQLSMPAGRADVFALQDILNAGGGIADLLPILSYQRIGFALDVNVSAAGPTNPNLNINSTMPNTFEVTYGGQPAGTDVVGVSGADYDGTNGSGSLFLMATDVHEWDSSGSTVAIPNSGLTGAGAPATPRRFASVSALYMDPSAHPSVAANRRNGVTSVLIRDNGSGGAPFGASGGSASVTDFLDIAGTSVPSPGSFVWENATSNGNAPLYSIHELVVRTETYLPVLSACGETENEVIESASVQWIVVRPFAANCSGDECFSLPSLPAGFPRSSAGTQMKSGFDQLVGSGTSCTGPGDCVVAGESCVDPDGAGAATSMCMAGNASGYRTQDYRWHLHLYDLELLASFDFDHFAFADRLYYMTHESFNRASF